MNKPFLSVVIPVYNRPDLIVPCVQSILQAEVDDVEIIIVDDCSTDHTWNVCCRLSEDSESVHILHLDRNHGVGFARNKGLLLARGEYVYFVDSDDKVDPAAFRTLLEQRAAWKQADMIGFNFAVYTETYRREDTFYQEQCLLCGDALAELYPQDTLWKYLFRKEFLIRNRLFHLHLAFNDDRLFSCETYRAATSVYITPLCVYQFYKRRESTSITETSKLTAEEWVRFLDWYKNRLSPPEKWDARPTAKRTMERIIRATSIEWVGDLPYFGEMFTEQSVLKTLCTAGAAAMVNQCRKDFWNCLSRKTKNFSAPVFVCPASPTPRHYVNPMIQHGVKIGGFLDKRRTGTVKVQGPHGVEDFSIFPFRLDGFPLPLEDACFLVIGNTLAVEDAMLDYLAEMGVRDEAVICRI